MIERIDDHRSPRASEVRASSRRVLQSALNAVAIAGMRRRLPPRLALPADYQSRLAPEFFDDFKRPTPGVVHQPDVYAGAAHVARLAGATHIVDVGCGAAEKLLPLAAEFGLIGIDLGADIERCRALYPQHTWISWDASGNVPLDLPSELVARSVVICADVIEHVVDPAGLLTALRRLAKRAVAVLVSTPERVLVRGAEDLGPPANSAHVREWSLRELVALLGAAGLSPTFKGLTANNSRDRMKRTSLAIIEPPAARTIQSAPADFQATAVMTAFNEADIVAPAICALLDQGVDVHLVDNWSTDGTADAARALGTGDRLTVESFPPDGPSDTYDWELLLCNVETIAHRRGGWILHQDVDELRRTPWPDISLRDGLWHVERRGYNAVDFTSLTFVPIDDNYRPGEDFEAYFRHFEFGARPGHFVQIKAWNADAGRADLASSGGHEAAFPGRRVFPWKFLSKHYPIRSQAHGERKVFAERVPRWNPDERTRGWHVQYDAVAPGSGFLRDHADLIEWHQDFHEVYLTERLTGIGVNRSAS